MENWATVFHLNRKWMSILQHILTADTHPHSQNEDMVLGQLDQTGKQLNVDCCHFHVMRTQKPGEPGPCGFYVEVDDAMFDQVFWSN